MSPYLHLLSEQSDKSSSVSGVLTPRSFAPETLQKSVTVVTGSGQPGAVGWPQPLSPRASESLSQICCRQPLLLGGARSHHCHPPSRKGDFGRRIANITRPARWGCPALPLPRLAARRDPSPAAVTALPGTGQAACRPHRSPHGLGAAAAGRGPALTPPAGPIRAQRGRPRGSPAAPCPTPPRGGAGGCPPGPRPPPAAGQSPGRGGGDAAERGAGAERSGGGGPARRGGCPLPTAPPARPPLGPAAAATPRPAASAPGGARAASPLTWLPGLRLPGRLVVRASGRLSPWAGSRGGPGGDRGGGGRRRAQGKH